MQKKRLFSVIQALRVLHSTLKHAKWQELILYSFYFSRVWQPWKNWFWTVSTLGGCGGLERTDFEQFLLCEGMVILKGLILNSFYFGRVWCMCNTYVPLKYIRGVWTYGGVGASGGIWMYGGIKTYWGCPDAPNIGGVNSVSPKCKTYIPLKKIRKKTKAKFPTPTLKAKFLHLILEIWKYLLNTTLRVFFQFDSLLPAIAPMWRLIIRYCI